MRWKPPSVNGVGTTRGVLDRVREAVSRWPGFADRAGVAQAQVAAIQSPS